MTYWPLHSLQQQWEQLSSYITTRVEDNDIPIPSQGDDDIRNMQWMAQEGIHKNINEFLGTKLQSRIIISAVSDRSYHPTYQYGTSAGIIKIHNNNWKIIGSNDILGDSNSQYSHLSELCGLIGDMRHI